MSSGKDKRSDIGVRDSDDDNANDQSPSNAESRTSNQHRESDDQSHLGAVGGTDLRMFLIPGERDSREVGRSASMSRDRNAPLSEDSEINRGKGRSSSFMFRKKKSEKPKEINKKRKTFWSFRLKNKLTGRSRKGNAHDIPEPRTMPEGNSCVCTGYRRTENESSDSEPRISCGEASGRLPQDGPMNMTAWFNMFIPAPVRVPFGTRAALSMLEMTNFNPDDYPVEDIDSINIRLRAREMEQGVEMSAGYPHFRAVGGSLESNHSQRRGNGNFSSGVSTSGNIVHFDADLAIASLTNALQNHCITSSASMYPPTYPTPLPLSAQSTASDSIYGKPDETYNEYQSSFSLPYAVHTQIDYVHCLVPDLKNIVNCNFYWGVMDRYEAEKLLENRPEGTFLLRDSAQDEFLFSVSFRRYGRSLHARIEQWNHKFSFDSHDPGVYASDTVCELIEHYKDPSCCMFFEPMLTIPLRRNFPFSLQEICRGVICNKTTYEALNHLPLPKSLKQYLKYYHYKQKVCVRRFDK